MRFSKILLGLLTLTNCIGASAQSPFVVSKNPNFGHNYPMVLSICDWYIDTEYPADGSEVYPLQLCDFIVKVNGKDVLTENGWDEFKKTDHITVEYFRWPDMTLESFSFWNDLYNEKHAVGDMTDRTLIVPFYKSTLPEMTIVRSNDVDFADYRTYDFLIEGNDPLTDEELLKEFMNGWLTQRMTRDTENPDVIFRIAKNTDESFSATYVPPTEQVIGTTTTINPVYSYITRRTSYQATNRVNTIQKPGHTEVTNVANVYLEVVALDAKKLNDPNQTTPPEIWKMTYSSNEVNDNRTPMKRYKDILAASVYPFKFPYPLNWGSPHMTGAFLVPSADKKSLTVAEVAPYSPAETLGLQAGDVILKINGKDKFKRRDMEKAGWSLMETDVLLGELPEQLLKANWFIFYDKIYPEKVLKNRSYQYKGIVYKGLNADKDNEFLVERKGKKIKLKGQLWLKELYDMDYDTFWEWCFDNNRMPYVVYPL